MAHGEKNSKPAVLIVGGLGAAPRSAGTFPPPSTDCAPGFIGRFLALHIHENHLASEVRLVDKVLPQLAWLAPEFEEACSKDKFVQADASRERTYSLGPMVTLHLYFPMAPSCGVPRL
jgi:hypothetical protein